MVQRSSPLPINLTHLERHSTDSFLEAYPSASSLRTITSSLPELLRLYPLPHIKTLYLHRLDETTFPLLSRCTHLQQLTIEGEIDVTCEQLDLLLVPILSNITTLTSLDIRYQTDGVDGVKVFSQLRHLALRGPTVFISGGRGTIHRSLEKAQQLESFTLEANSEPFEDDYEGEHLDPSYLLDFVPDSLTTLKIYATPNLQPLFKCLNRCTQLQHVVVSSHWWDSSKEILGLFISIHQLKNLSSFEFGRVSSMTILSALGDNNNSTIEKLTTDFPSVDWKSNYMDNKNNNNNNPISFLLLLSDHDEDIQREQLSEVLLKEFPQESIKVTTDDGVSFTLTNTNNMLSSL